MIKKTLLKLGRGESAITLINKNFKHFVTSQFVSNLGDSSSALAVSWYILEHHNLSTFSFVMAVNMAVRMISQITLGVVGDKYHKRTLLILGRAICTILSFILLLLFYFNYNSLFFIILTLTGLSIGKVLCSVGSVAIVDLVGKTQVNEAIRIQSISNQVSVITGGILSGVVVTLFKYKAALFIDFLSFAASLFITIKLDFSNVSGKTQSYLNELVNGFKYVAGSNLASLIPVFFFIQFSFALLSAGIPAHVKMKMEPWYLSALETSFYLGSLLGPILLSRIKINTFFVLFLLMGVITPLVVVPYFGIICYLVIGVMRSMASILIDGRLLLSYPSHYRARLSSIVSVCCNSAHPICLSIVGLMGASNPTIVIVASGVLLFATSFFTKSIETNLIDEKGVSNETKNCSRRETV